MHPILLYVIFYLQFYDHFQSKVNQLRLYMNLNYNKYTSVHLAEYPDLRK